jgi:hypothetical protein
MAGISWLGTSTAWLPASPIPFDKRSWPHIAHRRQSRLQFCCPLLKLLNRFLLHQFTSCLTVYYAVRNRCKYPDIADFSFSRRAPSNSEAIDPPPGFP